jgi:DNA-directed RNA polymerase specialized sigma24 family protein
MNRTQWEVEVKNVKAYLLTTARHLCIDMWKNTGEEELVSYDDELNEEVQDALQRKAKECDESVARIESSIYYKELYQSLPLNIILAGMSEYEKSILYMNAVDEMSPEEIAPIVKQPPGQVRYDLQKIHSRLGYRVRKYIEENGGNSPL